MYTFSFIQQICIKHMLYLQGTILDAENVAFDKGDKTTTKTLCLYCACFLLGEDKHLTHS